MSKTLSPSSVWIIQNIRGDYNDEYYTPRSTAKFFLTEHDAVAALVPFHQNVAAKSSIAKRINMSDDPGALWHELVRYIHFGDRFTDVERNSLVAGLDITLDALESVRRYSSNFDNGRDEYRILELKFDALAPCSNGGYESCLLEDLKRGTINQEQYAAALERHQQTWWNIEC